MNLDLYIDLKACRLVAGVNDPGEPELPPLTQGDRVALRLHCLERTAEGGYREVRPEFTTLKVGLGWIDRPPASGTWRLACGGSQTEDLPHAATKAAVAAALNALPAVVSRGGVAVEPGGASNIYQVRWLDRDLTPEDAVLTVEENRLAPKCFSRVLRYETDRGWLHLVKIFRAPLAFTDQFLFPSPPAAACSVAREGTGARNAVAALSIPDGASGSMELVWGGRSTVILPLAGLTAGALATALNDLYTDGVVRFVVTQPRRGVFYCEFVGPLGMAAQPAPSVVMHDQQSVLSPVGALALDGPGIELALDGAAVLQGLVLEGEITTEGEPTTLFQHEVALHNDMIDAPMALAADPEWLDWLRRPVLVDYNPDQAVVGMQGYQDFAGDGMAQVWTYTHNLGTLNVHITVRDNDTGLRLPDDTYTAEILNQNQVRITFPAAPAVHQYVVVISSANASAHYSPHGHSIGEVEGLAAALAALSAAGNPLELWPVIPLDKLPSIPASKIIAPLSDAHIPANIPRLDSEGFLSLATIPPEIPRLNPDGSLTVGTRAGESVQVLAPGGKLSPGIVGDLARLPGFSEAVRAVLGGGGITEAALSFAMPQWSELYPGRMTPPIDPDALDVGKLPRPGGLLPAIHDASIELVEEGPWPEAAPELVGRVYQNDTSEEFTLPGGLGRRGAVLRPTEFAGCDGRVFYPVLRQGSTTSYHPREFERELLLIDVNSAMLPVGAVCTVLLDFEVQILRSETRAQWVLLVEHGSFSSTASPAGTNISSLVWDASPMLSVPLRLTSVRTPHRFGVRITRGDSALVTETKLYRGAWSPAAAGPSAAPFALRARLARFDVEDGLGDPRGYVFLAFNPRKTSTATIV